MKREAAEAHRHFSDLAATRLDFELTADEESSLAAHLAGCADCRSLAASLTADDVLLRSLPQRDAPDRVATTVREAAGPMGNQ